VGARRGRLPGKPAGCPAGAAATALPAAAPAPKKRAGKGVGWAATAKRPEGEGDMPHSSANRPPPWWPRGVRPPGVEAAGVAGVVCGMGRGVGCNKFPREKREGGAS
jgi:hypothetical protein